MARSRNIKPGFFKNEVLGVADPLYSLLFEGLWVLADRGGKLEDRPMRIKAEVFPYRDGLDMEAMLNWLQDEGFIRRYEVSGKRYIIVLEFVKHQNPHKNETESEIPDPDGIGTKPEIIGSTRADSLSSDSLSSDSLSTADAAPSGKKRKTAIPPDFGISEAVKAWAKKEGYGQLDKHLDSFKRKVAANGYTYIDWDAAFMEAIRQDWAKLRGRTQNGAAPPPDGGEAEWHESQSGIEQRARELSLPAKRIDEQWPVFKARVMQAHQQGAH